MGFAQNVSQPNIIIIYTDDMGYGDISSFGNPTIHTPELDKMAAEGMKLSQFYVAATVCTPSRAALLTGSYPKRVGLEKGVLFPDSKTGLNPDEETIAEVLKKIDYKTACFGKWHLGHHDKFLPHRQGFDVFYGYPFSNDMSKKEQSLINNRASTYPWKLPVLSQSDTLELDPDQRLSTKVVTQKTINFIKENKASPFFIYLAHPMPHIPIYSSKKFEGKSVRGPYGDTIEEIDWSVGEILKTIKESGIDERTMVIFTSDNGPWKVYKTEGGSAGPLRGGKGTTWEGGQRVPCIVRWPSKVPSGSLQTQVLTNMDLLPTIASICNAELPNVKIDGVDMSAALFDQNHRMTSNPFLYYAKQGKLEGIRDGKYKLLIKDEGTFLFDLESDISEEYNLAEEMPEKISNLKKQMYSLDEKITNGKRPVGTL
ncbi:arylsulfatase [Arenibacter certesii]|uniref:Arylsulfatase n=2 Tax=Arenibacter certesii TaxID=228955 RepID=A0A918MH31_9FLAO|nr:arylsulfatase [Arenibacter certesii]